jgi:hypothetical protein
MVYEGEIDKTSRLAYGMGKCTHVKRPDMSWEGTFVNNKRTGFSKYINGNYGTVSYIEFLNEDMHGRKTDFKPAKENNKVVNFSKNLGADLLKKALPEAESYFKRDGSDNIFL